MTMIGAPANHPWEGFDPDATAFEDETLRAWTEDGISLRTFQLTAEMWEGEPVRVFGYVGIPPGEGPFPGILHIHGGGQTAFLEDVVYWCRRGYVALSFDWTGPTEGRENVTNFGKASTNKVLVEPTVQHSHLYHGAVIARRCLSYLARQPKVDPERLGIYGVSWGGFLTWLVNGTDPRVKTAIAIYGCGVSLPTPGSQLRPVPEDTQRVWFDHFEPIRYVDSQTGPLLYLGATNDFFGRMAMIGAIMGAADDRSRLAISPNTDHHITPDLQGNVDAWMALHLKGGEAFPRSPTLRLRVGEGGVPEAIVSAEAGEPIEDIRVHYSVGVGEPTEMFWRSTQVEVAGGQARASLPVAGVDSPIHAYATVYYERGIALSSAPVAVKAGDLGEVRATDEPTSVIDDFSEGIDAWCAVRGGGTGFVIPPACTYTEVADGLDGGRALGIRIVREDAKEPIGWRVGTRRPVDPKWAARGRRTLATQMRSAVATRVRVSCSAGGRRQAGAVYSAAVLLQGTGEWEQHEVACDEMKNADGEALANFDGVHWLEIAGASRPGETPLIGRVEWR
jgi:dienelactone hydrolase